MSVTELDGHPLAAARRLLGATFQAGSVTARIVEVEAYGGDPQGPWPDPASHSARERSTRNALMFGPPGHLYVYLSYGIHTCANITSGPEGVASAVLLRSAEILTGHDLVNERRLGVRDPRNAARGPGNLGSALGIGLSDYGTALFDPVSPLRVCLHDPLPDARIASGPRVGVSTAADRPWRLWLPESPAVSAYRRSPRAPLPAKTFDVGVGFDSASPAA